MESKAFARFGSADAEQGSRILLPALLAVLISFLAMYPVLQNGWVNWDDEEYVLRNQMVQDLNASSLAEMWATPEQVGLYHPLTMMSLAVDAHIWEKDAFGFHLSNLILHLFNVFLVFLLAFRLSGRAMVAFVTALLFGMHPMHVESVAWISARKDVLYTAFYLLCLLAWLRFLRAKHRRAAWYVLAILLFAAGLLSKAAALTLPLILLLIDYLQGRAFSGKVLWEKAPFFLMSVAAWWVAQAGQQGSESMMAVADYPLHKTPFIGARNVLVYLADAVVPLNMSPFHPFPFLGKMEVPTAYWFAPLPLLAGLAFLIRYRKHSRKLIFGLAFFLLTIGPFLQILPYGKAITAERYTYVAYIGLFILAGWGLHWTLQRDSGWVRRLRWPLLVAAGLWLAALGWRTHERIQIWENGETLWTATVEAYPNHYFGWLSRGKYRADRDALSAREDLARAIALNPPLAESHYEMGRSYDATGDLEQAFRAYTNAIERDSSLARAWLNRGLVKARGMKDLKAALEDFDQAVKMQPDYALGYLNRALAKKGLGDAEGAEADFGMAIEIEPWNAVFYRYRGSHLAVTGSTAAALKDFGKAAEIEPGNGENYFLMARVQASTGDLPAARSNAEKARSLGFQVPDGFPQEPPGP